VAVHRHRFAPGILTSAPAGPLQPFPTTAPLADRLCADRHPSRELRSPSRAMRARGGLGRAGIAVPGGSRAKSARDHGIIGRRNGIVIDDIPHLVPAAYAPPAPGEMVALTTRGCAALRPPRLQSL